jgi:beta-phosphoglucomutase-like phosphatase (HAD superfamily)
VAGDAVALEDTEAGVSAAKAAGVYTVGVLGTMGAERLSAADELAERVDVALIERLLGPPKRADRASAAPRA